MKIETKMMKNFKKTETGPIYDTVIALRARTESVVKAKRNTSKVKRRLTSGES